MKRSFITVLATALLIAACGDNSSEHRSDSKISLQDSGPVTFAVFGNSGQALDTGPFSALIEQANSTDLDFVVDLGNNLPPGVPAEGVSVLRDMADEMRNRFEMPVYPIAGPDDIFDYTSDMIYTGRYGPLWYGFTRGGIRFLVLSTEDAAYRHGFGIQPRIGEEQMSWLMDELADISDSTPAVLLMNRPLWNNNPAFWNSQLAPLIQTSPVVLAIACSPEGLMDWGEVNGVRAVTTGCVGPTEKTGPGLFPHMLQVSMNDDKILFSILMPDGTITANIPVDRSDCTSTERLIDAMTIPPIETGIDWGVNHTVDLFLENPFTTPLDGSFSFTAYSSTEWDIRPLQDTFTLNPGERRTIHIQLTGEAPELGPLPNYRATFETDGRQIASIDQTVNLAPPAQRSAERIAVRAQIPEIIPYGFEGGPLTIPVDIGSIDTCGRLIIYREETGEIPECLHVSPLVDLNPGLNQFTWNGTGLDGEPAPAGDIVFYLFAYNKEAPCTWIADGPPTPGGSFSIVRTLTGLAAETHTDKTLISYPIDDSPDAPDADVLLQVESLLDGLPLTGYARTDTNRLFLGTGQGVVNVVVRNNTVEPDRSFADGGYLRFTEFRNRKPGAPVYANGRLIVGIGGGMGSGPAILLFDSNSGQLLSEIDLGRFYGDLNDPPAIAADVTGITCAHPHSGMVLRFSYGGNLLWLNDRGDRRVGARDSDDASHTYGIGIDQYGFTYVGTPGTSVRTGVLGPDGRGLFRVILVQLPGLRTSQAIPVVEGIDTDGLYLVTEGGDHTYTYHIPFTIHRGRIVHTSETLGGE